jgi:hypothetical protein
MPEQEPPSTAENAVVGKRRWLRDNPRAAIGILAIVVTVLAAVLVLGQWIGGPVDPDASNTPQTPPPGSPRKPPSPISWCRRADSDR